MQPNYSHKPKLTKRDIIKSFASIPKDIVNLHKKFIALPNGHKIFWVFVAVGGIACLVALFDYERLISWSAKTESTHSSIISKYRSYKKLHLKSVNNTYLLGKTLVIDVNGKILKDYYFPLLKKDTKVSSMDVGTVVVIEDKKKVLAQYYSKGVIKPWKLVQKGCLVTIIDITKQTITAQKTFWGSKPPKPKTKSKISVWAGPYPDNQVLQYLKSIPTKALTSSSAIKKELNSTQ